jgi:ribosomal protein S18
MTENLPQKSIWPDPLVENFNDSDWPNLDLQDAEVLKWVTEHKRVLLRTITWNLCAKPPPPKEELCSNLLIRK